MFPTAHWTNAIQNTNNCNYFVFGANQPSKTKDDTGTQWTKSTNYPNQTGVVQNTSKLSCSPQLQAVVDRARAIKQSPGQHENAVYQWKPNRNNLTLNFHGYGPDINGERLV